MRMRSIYLTYVFHILPVVDFCVPAFFLLTAIFLPLASRLSLPTSSFFLLASVWPFATGLSLRRFAPDSVPRDQLERVRNVD
jgi:hypothetical protein